MATQIERPIILETKGITKRFGHLLANNDISIHIRKGEIIAILGENGAGKSTLMNILFGLYKPTSGSILLDGKPVSFSSPREAIAMGLGMVHQHFMLVPTLTVTQNIVLGSEPVRFGHVLYRQARREVIELSQRYGLEVNPDAYIEDLPVGIQQRVEILKALYRKARILILDEPTAVLTPSEVEDLFTVLRNLATDGTSIIIITHKLEEAKAISERAYVLRRGNLVAECSTHEVSARDLANFMVGRDVVLEIEQHESPARPEPIFRLEALSARSSRGLTALKEISLEVGRGEILGIAGVEGNGQKELCEVISGLITPLSGKILFKGMDVTRWTVRQRMDAGMGYVPPDRRGSGLVLPFSVEENLALGSSDRPPLCRHGLLNYSALRSQAILLMDRFDIRATGPDVAVQTLSGGNQQKVILAREFSRNPDFLLIAQPTRGLDVGAIEYVYNRILDLKQRGTAIILISMELDELFALSDRIAVLHGGEIVFESPASMTSQRQIGGYMIRGKYERSAS